MKITTVFLDMDGVIADFVGAVGKLTGREDLVGEWSPPGSYDLAKQLGFPTPDAFWRMIDNEKQDFWIGIDPYPWMAELVEKCRSIAKTIILTSPSRSPFSAHGKVQWLQDHFGARFRDYILCPAHLKGFLTRPDALLIDDADANVKAWTQSGGEAILFPRKWNSLHAESGHAARYVMGAISRLSEIEAGND